MKISKFKISKRITFLVCFILITFVISCNDSQKPHQENEEPSRELLAHLIKLDSAVSMFKRYGEQRISITKDTLRRLYDNDKFDDTRTVRFDLETIKSYIALVEKKSAENHIKPEGLQFYFSVYANNEGLGDKKNHQTFFIAPTTSNQSVQSGYTIVKEGDKEKVIFLKDVLNNSRNQAKQSPKIDKASFFTAATLVAEDGLLLNDGIPTPPGN